MGRMKCVRRSSAGSMPSPCAVAFPGASRARRSLPWRDSFCHPERLGWESCASASNCSGWWRMRATMSNYRLYVRAFTMRILPPSPPSGYRGGGHREPGRGTYRRRRCGVECRRRSVATTTGSTGSRAATSSRSRRSWPAPRGVLTARRPRVQAVRVRWREFGYRTTAHTRSLSVHAQAERPAQPVRSSLLRLRPTSLQPRRNGYASRPSVL
jgi:hypothetical protein